MSSRKAQSGRGQAEINSTHISGKRARLRPLRLTLSSKQCAPYRHMLNRQSKIANALPRKSIFEGRVSCLVSCDFVDRSLCPEHKQRSTKSHEPTRTKYFRLQLDVTFEAKPIDNWQSKIGNALVNAYVPRS